MLEQLPKKRPKRSMTVEVDAELYEKIKDVAKKGNLTLRHVVEYGLEIVVEKFHVSSKTDKA